MPTPEQTIDDARSLSMEGWKWYGGLSLVVTVLVAFYIVMIWTAEGWLYVAAVLDLFSRRVVGWSMSAGMTAQLVGG